MELAAATLATHKIVKDAVDVGVGLNSLYKAYKNQFQQSMDGVQWGPFPLQIEATQAQQGSTHLREDMKTFGQAIQKVFDSQASLLALISEENARLCGEGLLAIQLQIEKGFDSAMQVVKDMDAIRAARDFITKLKMAALACSRMLEAIAMAAESHQTRFSPGGIRDIERAEISATELYVWAKSFVLNTAGAVTKQSKLQPMPYIVAMAYAARIQVITHILERDIMDQESDQITCLKRARKVVEDFSAVLAGALEGVMADTSLLQVAMDYQLPMAMYLTLMTSFRTSVDELLLSPSAERKDIVVWDDGLSPIRDVLRLDESGAHSQGEGRTIQLDSIQESLWWAIFTDTDITAVHASQLRTSIHVRELCQMLGAANDERIDSFALKPGQKSALLQLPPASALRAALCADITRACRAAFATAPPPPPPQSFARTSMSLPPLETLSLHTAAAPRTLDGHTHCVYSAAVGADGKRVLSGSADGTARVWSLSSGQPLSSSSDHTDEVNCVALSPDGKTAVSGSDDMSVRVWSLESESAPHSLLQGHSNAVWGVAVSPGGRSIASGSADSTVKLWNAESGQCEATLIGHSHCVFCVAFSPDGARLISGSADKAIKVWSVRTRALERTLHGHSNTVASVAVTPDGLRLVSGGWDRMVRVWRLSSGAEEMRLEGHGGVVRSVAVFPDGERIVSGSWDKSIRVWNVSSRALELTLTGHSDAVQSVAVAPDGRSVVSSGGDRTIRVWSV